MHQLPVLLLTAGTLIETYGKNETCINCIPPPQ